jgi:hypothetical protein
MLEQIMTMDWEEMVKLSAYNGISRNSPPNEGLSNAPGFKNLCAHIEYLLKVGRAENGVSEAERGNAVHDRTRPQGQRHFDPRICVSGLLEHW